MAKGKHSAALFEVIRNPTGSQPQKPRSGFSLSKWLKSRFSDVAGSRAVAESSAGPSAASAASLVAADARARAVADPFRAPHAERSSAIHIEFSPDHQDLTLRMRYTTAMVCLFGLMVLMGIAFVIGRNAGSPTVVVAPVPVAQAPRPAPRVAAVDANRTQVPRLMATDTNGAPRNSPTPPKPTPPPVPVGPLATTTALPRKVGLNYAIVQTYPPEENKAAEAMRDFLNAHGVPCTLEKTSYARNSNWVCLTGTTGFQKIKSAEYRAYIDGLVGLGEKYKNPAVDRLKPAAYKWKDTDGAE